MIALINYHFLFSSYLQYNNNDNQYRFHYQNLHGKYIFNYWNKEIWKKINSIVHKMMPTSEYNPISHEFIFKFVHQLGNNVDLSLPQLQEWIMLYSELLLCENIVQIFQPTKLKSIHLGTVPSIVKNNVRAIGINTDVYGPARYVPQAITKAFDLEQSVMRSWRKGGRKVWRSRPQVIFVQKYFKPSPFYILMFLEKREKFALSDVLF
ncbi:hypothetical protein BCV71DRAFT_237117 [Rhizopus microsporus]|uniref:Uncharacterized protein n=1 Tax=Rhizopus microsporus TaxID=58291 RepID=A0A1X0RV29_RHIZD|nr:hypothetical protein BCV71DRAFT_237117 [Rhizopus microsporus]